MAEFPIDPFARTKRTQASLARLGVFEPTPWTTAEVLEQRKRLSGLPGLEPADYAAQGKEATELAKLQMALALAQRGFASMGAAPQRGESPIGTIGRTLLSPIAADIAPIAGRLMEQRRAAKTAERADKARLSQAALTMQQQLGAREDAARDKRFTLAKSLVERKYTPTKDLQRTVNGKTSDFLGFYYTDKVTNLPVYVSVNNDGTLEEVPSDQLSEYRKPGTALKAVGATRESRAIWVPVPDPKSPTGSKLEKQYVTQGVQIIPDIETGPRQQFGSDLYFKGTDLRFWSRGRDKKLRNPVSGLDYFPSDAGNYKDPAKTQLYVRDDLPASVLATARSYLGDAIGAGEGVNQYTFRHKVDPTQSRSLFDIKGRPVRISQAQADEWLTITKPKDLIPAGGKPLGNIVKEFSVADKAGKRRNVMAALMIMPNRDLLWKQTGEGGQFLDKEFTDKVWGVGPKDSLWQRVRPVLNKAFQDAVARRTDILPERRERLGEQVLKQTEIQMLASLTGDARNTALSNLINERVRKLPKGAGAEALVTVPPSVFPSDPRVEALTRKPTTSGLASPVINPLILKPWKRGGKALQLGTGSHEGFTRSIPADEFAAAEKNFPAINRAFSDMYEGRKMGDAEEKVLVFSGLWKHLPGVAEGQNVRILDDDTFKKRFDSALAKYNKAKGEYKYASGFDIGKGKFLQGAVDENLDAVRDNVIMRRFSDMGGAWFAGGTWWSEFLESGLGELGEKYLIGKRETMMPSNKWADIAKPDNQLNEADLALKRKAFAWMKNNTTREGGIELTQFERAAEYLAALSRYKIRAFQMIDDSRPSDRDIEILLGAFVAERDSNTKAYVKLSQLLRNHVRALSRNISKGLAGKAVFSPNFLVNLDHTSRALASGAVLDVDLRAGGRAVDTARLYEETAAVIGNAAKSVSGRILPGYRGGAISPLSKAVDEEATANMYRLISNAAQQEYPGLSQEEAVKKFIDMGLDLVRHLGTFGGAARQSTPGVVFEGSRIVIPAAIGP